VSNAIAVVSYAFNYRLSCARRSAAGRCREPIRYILKNFAKRSGRLIRQEKRPSARAFRRYARCAKSSHIGHPERKEEPTEYAIETYAAKGKQED